MIKVKNRRHYTPIEIGILLFFSLLLFLARWQMRFQSSEKILNSLNRRRQSSAKAGRPLPRIFSLERLVWLLETADRRSNGVPSCLRRALVLSRIFKWLGRDSDIQVQMGVRRQGGQDLEAHTWLEYQGIPLESPLASPYQPLSKLD